MESHLARQQISLAKCSPATNEKGLCEDGPLPVGSFVGASDR